MTRKTLITIMQQPGAPELFCEAVEVQIASFRRNRIRHADVPILETIRDWILYVRGEQ